MMHVRPPERNSRLTVAPGIALSMSVVPKPPAAGFCTGGPPVSCHSTLICRTLFPRAHSPGQRYSAGLVRQCAVFGGIARQFVQHEAERRRQVRRQQNRFSGDAQSLRTFAAIAIELLVGELGQFGAFPVRLHQQRMGAGERREPTFKSLEFFFIRLVAAEGVARNGLDHRQDCRGRDASIRSATDAGGLRRRAPPPPPHGARKCRRR